ncbi:MAG: hypothetical protein K0S61_562 [Anaerocolumna sp.]|jgi:hypothetical protein|nr:hypothetical protein [Anaerocolumna sp.]
MTFPSKSLKAKSLYQAFSTRRFDWQNKAIEEIKKNLCVYPAFEGITSQEERIAIACGLPQSGKTELILSLLGIHPEYVEEVYDVIRAGQPEGSSSTSTAICYRSSNENRFEVRGIPELLEHICFVDSEGYACYTDDNIEKIKDSLRHIRLKVENGKASHNIVYIYIPKCFFSPEISHNYLNIIDLPGLHSGNQKEEQHVQMLASKYFPLANVVLFVCRSNEVARIEGSAIEQTLNKLYPAWKQDSERFIIVPTQAYTGSSLITKDTVFSDSKTMCQAIRQNCEKETRRHLPSSSKVEVFPIDVGRSLRRLNEDFPLISRNGESFIHQIHTDCEETILNLRISILKRRNRLPLKVILSWNKQTDEICRSIEIYHNNKLDNLKVEARETYRNVCNVKQNLIELRENLILKKEENREELSELNNSIGKLGVEVKNIIDQCITDFNIGFNKIDSKNLKKKHSHDFLVMAEKYIDEIYSAHTAIGKYRKYNIDDIFPFNELQESIERCFEGAFFGISKEKCRTSTLNALKSYIKENKQLLDTCLEDYRISSEKEIQNSDEMAAIRVNQAQYSLKLAKTMLKKNIEALRSSRSDYEQARIDADEALSSLKDCESIINNCFNEEKCKAIHEIESYTGDALKQTYWIWYYTLIKWDYDNLKKTVIRKIEGGPS